MRISRQDRGILCCPKNSPDDQGGGSFFMRPSWAHTGYYCPISAGPALPVWLYPCDMSNVSPAKWREGTLWVCLLPFSPQVQYNVTLKRGCYIENVSCLTTFGSALQHRVVLGRVLLVVLWQLLLGPSIGPPPLRGV